MLNQRPQVIRTRINSGGFTLYFNQGRFNLSNAKRSAKLTKASMIGDLHLPTYYNDAITVTYCEIAGRIVYG